MIDYHSIVEVSHERQKERSADMRTMISARVINFRAIRKSTGFEKMFIGFTPDKGIE